MAYLLLLASSPMTFAGVFGFSLYLSRKRRKKLWNLNSTCETTFQKTLSIRKCMEKRFYFRFFPLLFANVTLFPKCNPSSLLLPALLYSICWCLHHHHQLVHKSSFFNLRRKRQAT